MAKIGGVFALFFGVTLGHWCGSKGTSASVLGEKKHKFSRRFRLSSWTAFWGFSPAEAFPLPSTNSPNSQETSLPGPTADGAPKSEENRKQHVHFNDVNVGCGMLSRQKEA